MLLQVVAGKLYKPHLQHTTGSSDCFFRLPLDTWPIEVLHKMMSWDTLGALVMLPGAHGKVGTVSKCEQLEKQGAFKSFCSCFSQSPLLLQALLLSSPPSASTAIAWEDWLAEDKHPETDASAASVPAKATETGTDRSPASSAAISSTSPGETQFCAADEYAGSREGFVFRMGEEGLGYYPDRPQPCLSQLCAAQVLFCLSAHLS